MKITVKVKLRAKIEKVTQLDADLYEVSVRAPPVDGKANERIRELLAEYFKLRVSRISLLKGEKSTEKVFEIEI